MSARLKITPTTRTLSYLQQRGWLCDVVERRERYATYDCFGCWDILAIRLAGGASSLYPSVLLVQCTSNAHVSTRAKKCVANPNTQSLLNCGVRCEVWGWSDGKADPRIVVLT